MNVIWLILNLSTTIQLAETVSVAGKVGSQHGPHWKSFFIEIQRQGIILALVCLCKSKMWKSNVKNVFNHFPRWSEVSLIAQSLTGETHQTHLRFDVSIKHFSIVWCFMYTVNIWTGMASNNTISWYATYDSTVQYQNTDLFPPWTRLRIADSSALLDELCPYFCLNPMMVHRKTCVLMYL